MALAACVAALAQTPTYNLGRTPTEEEIRAWDIAIGPDGKGTPAWERNRQGRREDLCAEVRGMPRANRDREANGLIGSLLWWEAKARSPPLTL